MRRSSAACLWVNSTRNSRTIFCCASRSWSAGRPWTILLTSAAGSAPTPGWQSCEPMTMENRIHAARPHVTRNERLIFERSRQQASRAPNLRRWMSPVSRPPNYWVRSWRARRSKGFREVSELEVVRHFTRLSTWNYGVDTGAYPLGSCTMKYNPRINEVVARLKAWRRSIPTPRRRWPKGACASCTKQLAASRKSPVWMPFRFSPLRRAGRVDRHPDDSRLSCRARRSPQVHLDS